MDVRIWVSAAPNTADFSLLVQAVNQKGEPVATLASMSVDDPNLSTRLRDVFQAYRMGARFGEPEQPVGDGFPPVESVTFIDHATGQREVTVFDPPLVTGTGEH